jgi:hypothetical protein
MRIATGWPAHIDGSGKIHVHYNMCGLAVYIIFWRNFMKKSIYYGVFAVMALLFAACPEEVADSGGAAPPKPKGNETPDVYVTFTATPGVFQGGGGALKVPLAFNTVQEVAKWYAADGSEITGDDPQSAFLSALDAADESDEWLHYGYDYNDDPKKLKKTSEEAPNPQNGLPAFLFSEVQKYRYFIQQQEVNGEWVDMFAAPVASNRIFTGWRINGTPASPVRASPKLTTTHYSPKVLAYNSNPYGIYLLAALPPASVRQKYERLTHICSYLTSI